MLFFIKSQEYNQRLGGICPWCPEQIQNSVPLPVYLIQKKKTQGTPPAPTQYSSYSVMWKFRENKWGFLNYFFKYHQQAPIQNPASLL